MKKISKCPDCGTKPDIFHNGLEVHARLITDQNINAVAAIFWTLCPKCKNVRKVRKIDAAKLMDSHANQLIETARVWNVAVNDETTRIKVG